MKKIYNLIYFIISIMFLLVGVYALRHFNKLDFINSWFAVKNKENTEEIMNNTSSLNEIIFNKKSSNSPYVNFVGYNSLSNMHEKNFYVSIKLNVEKITNEKSKDSQNYIISPINVYGSQLTTSQIKKVLYAFEFDNPEIFWVSSVFTYSHTESGTLIKLNSIFSPAEKEIALKKFNDKISSIISEASKKTTDYEKELYIHDYLIKNCQYKKSSSNPKIYTAYGCLVDKEAVCEGYSKAMQILLCNLGIKCQTITGSRQKEPHMWNITKIEDNWYHIDVTWDSVGELQQYDYFNLTDELIKNTHTINNLMDNNSDFSKEQKYNFYLPNCNSLKHNYMELNSVKIENLDNSTQQNIIKKLVSLASENKNTIHLKIKNNYEEYKTKLINGPLYIFFKCLESANSSLINGHKLSSKQSQFVENKSQNVLTLKLIYA